MKKHVYRIIYVEYLNNKIVYQCNENLKYEETDYKDDEIIYSSITYDFYLFKEALKNKEIKTTDFALVNRFGKEIIKHYTGWEESSTFKEKHFKDYYCKRYVTYCDNYTLNQLKSQLPAEQYIEWCKDHGITNESIVLEL